MKRVLAVLTILALATVAVAQQPVNNAQQAGTTTLTGNGTTGAGSQRVTIASDNTAFSVNATLSAETTKIIGTVNQGTSPWVDNVSQVGGNNVLTGNGTTGTGSLRVTIASDNTAFAVNSTLSAETTKVIGTVRLLGNAGAIMDFAGQDATQPANSLLVGAEFNTTPTTLTDGKASPLQLDSAGKLLVNCTGCSAGSTTQLVPGTSGGLTLSHLLLANTDNATSLKASAGQLYSACLYSNSVYPIYGKFYNKASAPAPGSDTVVFALMAQAGLPGCFHSDEGAAFATGIAYAVVKLPSNTDDTSVLASDGLMEIAYK